MLEHLGSAGFGIWVTGISLIGLAAFMDFGLGNSLLTRLAGHFGRSDAAAARQDIGVSYRILSYIFLGGLLVLALGLALVGLWPRARIAMVEGDGILIVVTLLFFLLGLPLSVAHRALYAHQQIALYNLLLIAGAVASVGLTLSAISMGLPGWAAVAAYSGAPVVLLVIASIWYFRAFPQYRPRGRDFDYNDSTRAMLRLGFGHLALGILTAVGLNVDIPLILYTMNSEAVTDFAMPARIGSLMQTAVATAFMPLWSFNGAAIAREDYAWVRRNAVRMSLGGGLAIAALGGALTAGIDPIMQFWTGRAFPDQTLVIATMAIAATIMAVTSPWNMVLNAAGRVGVQIWVWGAFVLVSVLGKVLLIPVQGAWIVSVVTAMAYLACVTPVIIIAALRITGGRH
ncbi:MAG: lipopolysaccharide biosynthesis protein [Paracoccaceae bacterium]